MNEAVSTYLTVLARWWRLALAVTLIGVIAASCYLILRPSQYESTAVLFVSTPRDDANTYYRGDTYSRERIGSYAALGQSPEIAQRVIDDTMLDTDPASLIDDTTLMPIPETVLLQLTTTGRTPREAQAVAEAYVDEIRRSVAALETVPGALTPRAELITVQSPSLPTEKAGLSQWLILGAAAGLGLIIGCFAVVLVALLDGRIRRPEDAAEATGTPILARFSGPVVWDQAAVATLAGESARSLRAALDRLSVLGARVILVASAEAEAGKTGVAVTVARALADRGSSVALVDFDARGSRIADALDLGDAETVHQILSGEHPDAPTRRGRASRVPPEFAVGGLPESNWHGVAVVPFGSGEDNPGASADSPGVADMFAALRSRYQWIIVDSPAVEDYSDAARVARHCDAVILVARAAHTSFDKLKNAADELTGSGGSVGGVVFLGTESAETTDHAAHEGQDEARRTASAH